MTLPRFWYPTIVVLAAVALALVELVAFNRFAGREVTWGYPTGYDQLHYGLESFRLYDGLVGRGMVRALRDYVASPSPQGMLLQLEGALACAVVGLGWLPLLNVNFLHFILLQGATAYAAWHVGGRRLRWALLALGLVLALGTPYFWAGGIMDFRLDFAAFCLYGTFIALVVRSGVFASWRWSLGAWLIAAMLVWLRIIALAYLAGIGVALIVFLGLRLMGLVGLRPRAESARQLRNLVLGLTLLVALALPVAIVQAPGLYAYYWRGHVASQEAAIRAAEFGVRTLRDHLTFYPWSLLRSHLGPTFLVAASLVVAVAAGVWWRDRRGRRSAFLDRGPAMEVLVFCALGVAEPLTLLTLDVSKSPVVAGITTPAVLWLVVIGAMRLGGLGLSRERLGSVLALSILFIGLGHTSRQLGKHLPLWSEREQVRRLVDVYDGIGAAATRLGDSEPRSLSTFAIADYMRENVVNFVVYARHRRMPNLTGELGHSIFATNLEQSLAAIDRSAFVVTIDARPGARLVYPFDRSLQPLIPGLRDYVRERFVFMTAFDFRGLGHEVYRRPVVSVRGTVDGWVTREGLLVEVSEEDRARASTLVLEGSWDTSRAPGLKVSATARAGPAGRDQVIPVDVRVTGNDYVISIPLTGLADGPGPLSFRLAFSTSTAQGDPGIGEATRPIIRAPRTRTLLLKTSGAPADLESDGVGARGAGESR